MATNNERINSLCKRFRESNPYLEVDQLVLEECISQVILDHPISQDDCILTWAEDMILGQDLAEDVIQ